MHDIKRIVRPRGERSDLRQKYFKGAFEGKPESFDCRLFALHLNIQHIASCVFGAGLERGWSGVGLVNAAPSWENINKGYRSY